MTLSTDIYVHDEIDAREVFARMAQLLGAPLTYRFREEGNSIAAAPMQGLPAWLIVTRNADGTPVQTTKNNHWDECESDCDYNHSPAHYLRVDVDTPYGYTGPDGEGCGDLHARLVTELGLWLDEREVTWSWRNEFTGEIFSRYDGLEDLAESGAKAEGWFRTRVLPMMRKELR